MSSTSPRQLWIVNFQLWIRIIIVLHKSSAIMNCELHLWILWLPFELLPHILDVPRTYLRRSFDVSWMYLESTLNLSSVLLPSSYLLATFFLPSFYPLFCIYQKTKTLPFSTILNCELSIMNCQLWISIILCVNTDFWKIFKIS